MPAPGAMGRKVRRSQSRRPTPTSERPTGRSRAEGRFIADLLARGVEPNYEADKIHYTLDCSYTPDTRIRTSSGKDIYVEFKGWMDDTERRIYSQVRKQHPDTDLRIVFEKSETLDRKVRKTGKMTYRDWCQKYGIPCASEFLPEEWLKE